MKNSPRFGKWQELRQRINVPLIWQLLAIFQIIVLLTFFLTWPPVTLPPVTLTPVTLSLVLPSPEAEHWSRLIEDFHAKNPDIRIVPVTDYYTTDQVKAIYTAAFKTGRSPYDLVYMDIIWVPEFAKNEWLKDLSDKISEAELAGFLTGDVDTGRYQDGLYRIPFRSDAGVLYYRKDLLDNKDYQPPKTFEELFEISQSLQQQDASLWGYFWQGKKDEGLVAMFVEVLQGYGGFWIKPTTREVGLDQPEALAAVKFLQDTIKQGISPPDITDYDEKESFNHFKQGESVFLRSWPYVWERVNKDHQDNTIQGKVGITPMVHAPGKSSAACKGGWGLGIAKNAQHPQEAWRAIQFFTSEAAQRDFVLKSGYLPSRESLFNDKEIVKRYSHFPEVLKMVKNAVLRPPIPKYDQASKILQLYLSAALKGQPSEEKMKAAAKAAANETRKLLSEF